MRRPSGSSPELVPPPSDPFEADAPESAVSGPYAKPSGTHARIVGVPERWLDRLFVAACDMPVDRGEREVVEALVRTVSELLPLHSVGVVLCVRNRTPELVLGASSASSLTAPLLPTGERLFPDLCEELIVPVGAAGTTLHLGAADPGGAQLGSEEHALLLRTGLAMERGLSIARAQIRARGATQELHALSSHMVQAEKLASIGQLAAGIVHELNNPLTSIVVYTDALLRQGADSGDEASMERLRRIGDSAGRMLRFTRDLISYARPSRAVQVAVSLEGVLRQALSFCEHVLTQASAEVVHELGDPEDSMVLGMPEQLAQVFVNLVTNACHAMENAEQASILRVAIRATRQSVHVVVEDNGSGVAEENLAHLFTPFFTTKAPGVGTGLGLSIVKKIVDDHRAQIEVERRHEGGTRFVLTFPRLGGRS